MPRESLSDSVLSSEDFFEIKEVYENVSQRSFELELPDYAEAWACRASLLGHAATELVLIENQANEELQLAA